MALKLRDLRDSKGLTCKEMANAMGISEWKYKRRENGLLKCKTSEIASLINRLNLSNLELKKVLESV